MNNQTKWADSHIPGKLRSDKPGRRVDAKGNALWINQGPCCKVNVKGIYIYISIYIFFGLKGMDLIAIEVGEFRNRGQQRLML